MAGKLFVIRLLLSSYARGGPLGKTDRLADICVKFAGLYGKLAGLSTKLAGLNHEFQELLTSQQLCDRLSTKVIRNILGFSGRKRLYHRIIVL